ncbi:MAG: hypothetical protein J6T97_06925 [Bacteroidaceae bacterium]|nr:hypothetical protein [Bacteroidaceae bacterium]MBO7437535.1 hypothetical protein [Bacteroidaceae bacterium]
MEHKPLYDVFCPLCNHSVGVRGERTAEIYHQYVAWCKHCKTEFVISYFKAVEYGGITGTVKKE